MNYQKPKTTVDVAEYLISPAATDLRLGSGAGLFNALYMNLIDCSAAMPPIARLYLVLATFSARLKRRMLAANERILAKAPGFLRIREASSAKLPSRT